MPDLVPKNRARFLFEAAQSLGIGGELRRQHLDRDVAPETRVPRTVHLAHAPRTDWGDDLVGAQARTGRECHFSPSTR